MLKLASRNNTVTDPCDPGPDRVAKTSMASRCRICGKPVTPQLGKIQVFCSERCRLIDLAKWFGEEYRVPDRPEESEDAPAAVPEVSSDDETKA